jgi:hypothetical protein
VVLLSCSKSNNSVNTQSLAVHKQACGHSLNRVHVGEAYSNNESGCSTKTPLVGVSPPKSNNPNNPDESPLVALCVRISRSPVVSALLARQSKVGLMFNALAPAKPQAQRRPQSTPTKKSWTAEEDAQLTEWHGEGVFLEEIGLRLGLDRFAVMQRAKRLGLPGRRSR